MANKNNVEVVGKEIVFADRTDNKSAIIKLDDGTVITFHTVDHYDQMLGAWSTLTVDVV